MRLKFDERLKDSSCKKSVPLCLFMLSEDTSYVLPGIHTELGSTVEWLCCAMLSSTVLYCVYCLDFSILHQSLQRLLQYYHPNREAQSVLSQGSTKGKINAGTEFPRAHLSKRTIIRVFFY